MAKFQKRKVFIFEGSQEKIDEIQSLLESEFESENLKDSLGIKILDVGPVFDSQNDCIAHYTERDLVSLRNFLNNIFEKDFQPILVRNAELGSTDSATGSKLIQLGCYSVELIVDVKQLEKRDVQIFLRVRSSESQRYLPDGLQIVVMDEYEEVLIEKSIDKNTQVNLIDITKGGKFICESGDCFSVKLILGSDLFTENFLV